MESILQGWLSIWLYVIAAIGLALGVLVWKKRKEWQTLNILCTLAIIVLILHVIEEWVLPGGLHYSYNIAHDSTLLSKYPMNRLTDMITNFGAIVVGCIVLKIWGFRKPSAVAIMLFSAFEVGMHIVIGIQDMQIFGIYGMNTIYSPGLLTSLFGFLPVCVGLAGYLFKRENRPSIKQWVIAIASSAILGFLLISLPEELLGSEDNPYEFTNRGYYESFGEQYERDNGYEYWDPDL